MAFSLVPTKSSGNTISTSNWNTGIRDNINGMLYPPGASVYNSANISVGSGGFVALTFNSEFYDTGGMHSLVSNTERLTVVTAGLYVANLNVYWSSNSAGIRTVLIRKNGSVALAYCDVPANSTGGCGQNVTTAPVDLSASDYLEAIVFQDSGSTLTVNYGASYSPVFSAHWVGLA